jgi:4-carboxymuconolactone decarboxylase
MTDERQQRGERVRREVLGDEHVDAAVAATTEFTRVFQEHVTGAAWADVWGRPGLDRRTRSAITLALLTALRAEAEIPMHVRAALRHGLTADEIAEVLLHATVYAGAPAGNAAFRIADEVLREAGPGENGDP